MPDPNINVPKGVSNDAEFQNVPGAYFVEEIVATNQNGAVFDLRPLVTNFTITEELFSPVFICNLQIRDNINFFEDFSLSGQEKIRLTLLKQSANNSKTSDVVSLSFIVKEYNNYSKSPQSAAQEYSIVAISDFAYLSMIKRISRSVRGNVVENISKIFKRDLNVGVTVTDSCVSSFDGVLVIQTPLKAVEWLRQKAFDSKGAPFFVFCQIYEKLVYISSLTRLLSGPIYRTYAYKPSLRAAPGTDDYYVENRDKVINIKSNIKLDKLSQALDGAYSNTTVVTDFAKKSFIQKIFNRNKDSQILSNRLDPNSKIGKTLSFIANGLSGLAQPLSEMPDASRTLVSSNSDANSSGAPNSGTLAAEHLGRIKSYLSNMDTLNHQVEVYGDFRLNPGKKIRLNIPKSIDFDRLNSGPTLDPTADIDQSLSGVYLVAACVHSFKGGVYTNVDKIIK